MTTPQAPDAGLRKALEPLRDEFAQIIDPGAYELYTRPDGEVVFWAGPAGRNRALAKADAIVARAREALSAVPTVDVGGEGQRAKVVKLIEALVAPHLRDSGYRKILDPAKGIFGGTRPLRIWSPTEPIKLDGYALSEVLAVTEDGVIEDATGGGAVQAGYDCFPIEDLEALHAELVRALPQSPQVEPTPTPTDGADPLELDRLEEVARRLLAVEGMDPTDDGEADAWSDADDAFSEAFTAKTVLRLIAMARGMS